MLGSLVRQAVRGLAATGPSRAAAASEHLSRPLTNSVSRFQESLQIFEALPGGGFTRSRQGAASTLPQHSFAAAARKHQPSGAEVKEQAHDEAETSVGDAAEQDTAATLKQAGAAASTAEATSSDQSEAEAAATGAGQAPEANLQQLQDQLAQRDAMLLEKDGQIEEITERSLRAMADLENMRDRSARQAETSRKFAVQGFAKSLLEVADNLERALSNAPEQEQGTSQNAEALYRSLRDGLQLTNKVLHQVFQQNGLVKYTAMGEKFDPNLHNALFEMPDPSKPAGTVAAVTKAGYKLHDRVLRPAEVGVARSQADST